MGKTLIKARVFSHYIMAYSRRASTHNPLKLLFSPQFHVEHQVIVFKPNEP